jgi:hypothetical protein
VRRAPNGRERLTGLFVVLGATIMFGPIVVLLEWWREVFARDLKSSWSVPWLSEQLMAHPYLTLGALLLDVAVASVLVMLVLVGVAKRLAAHLTHRKRPGDLPWEKSTGRL